MSASQFGSENAILNIHRNPYMPRIEDLVSNHPVFSKISLIGAKIIESESEYREYFKD